MASSAAPHDAVLIGGPQCRFKRHDINRCSHLLGRVGSGINGRSFGSVVSTAARAKLAAFREGASTVVETLWNHKTADKFCLGRIIRGEMARGGLQGFTEGRRSEDPFVKGFVIRR